MSSSESLERLLANATWLKGLARHLLADRGWAEDAAQETWVAALRGGPESEDSRPWLARVLRNAIGQRARSERARGEREQRAARPEALPGTDEVVARAELFARLVRAVLELEEPYRTTILWRYFEELPSEEIARRAKIDVATVRSRTKRAREQLREKLVTKDGEPPERWLAALAGTVGIGGTVVGIKSGVAAALVVVAVVAFVWRETSRGAPRTAEPDLNSMAAVLAAPLPPDEPVRAPASATALREERAPELVAEPAAARLRGLELSEAARRPLAGVEVLVRRGSEEPGVSELSAEERTQPGTTTGADGRFALERPESPDAGLWFEAEGHFPFKLSPADLPSGGAGEIEVLLAPLGHLEFELVDDLGAPMPDIDVAYSIDVNRGSSDHRWAYRRSLDAGRTDAAGRLTIIELPCGMPIDLRQGGEWGTFLGTTHIDPTLRVAEFRAVIPRSARIVGTLVDERGAPVAEAHVQWRLHPLYFEESADARSGSDGSFEIRAVKPQSGELRLELAGFEPRVGTPEPGATLDLGRIVVPDVARVAGRLTSRFVSPEAALRAFAGVDVRLFHAGNPLANPRLRGDAFEAEVVPTTLEVLVSRGGFWHESMQRPEVVLARVALAEPRSDLVIDLDATTGALAFELTPGTGEVTVALHAADDAASAMSSTIQAVPDARGRVLVPLLAPGRYRVAVHAGDGSALSSAPFEVAASALAELGKLVARSLTLRGHVRTAAGAVVEGAHLELRNWTFERAAVSDAAGAFAFTDLPAGTCELRLQHAELGALTLDDIPLFEPDAAPLELVLHGFAGLIGRVTSAGEPVRALSIDAQPALNNESYNSITDDDGVFRFERLPACRLRLWAQGKFVEIHELVAGETHELTIELSTPRTLRFTHAGLELADVEQAHALGLEAGDAARNHWRTGTKSADGFLFDLPPGRVLFDVNRTRAGSNESWLALATPTGAEVELAPHTLTLDGGGAWEGALPLARLVAFEGRPVLDRWARAPELALERGADGRLTVPCLPPGARVRLLGFDARGRPHEEELDIAASSTLAWP
jgi:RNA polymerase sigma-70 factor (ECF subfamily)